MIDRKPSTWLNYGPLVARPLPDRSEMVRELTPDEWPFATDEERAAGWENRGMNADCHCGACDHERINTLVIVDIVQALSIVVLELAVAYLLVTK